MAVILLLEDNQEFRQILVENLEDEGHVVHGAADAAAAVQLAAQFCPDLMVTDVRMAGMDGIDALGEVRKLHPRLKSIVITGYANEEAPPRAIRHRACDYIYKPFKLTDLLDSIDRTLESEQETRAFSATLSPLLGGFRKLTQAIGSMLSNQQLKAVESFRQDAYSSFYVGVRSRSLDLEQALRVWDALEDQEAKRQGLKSGRLDLGLCRELAEGYQLVLSILEALQKTTLPVLRERPGQRVSRDRFAHFYEAVQQGHIHGAQLPLAPFLRTADPAALAQSPELSELHHKFWG